MNELLDSIENIYSTGFLNVILGNSTFFITAPNLIWFGTWILVVIFSYNLIRLFFATHRIQKELNKHTALLTKSRLNSPSLTGEVLEDLDKELHKSMLLSHCWSEFRETLISEDKEGQKLIFNTRAANEFFPKDAVCEANLKVHLYNALPGVLTGIGLLFTFLAILIGLNDLVRPGSSEISQDGMIHLVQSLSGKFFSSVCALTLATCFVLIEKTLSYKVEKNYKRLLQSLDSRFPRRSTEYLLEKIVASSAEQADQLRHFGADLSGRLKQGMTESFAPILERLVQAMDKLESERSNTLEGSMNGMIQEFRAAMTQSADGEIKQLASVLGSTSEVLKQSNEQALLSQKKMDDMITQMDVSQNRQAEATGAVLERLGNTVDRMSSRMKEASEDSSNKMAEKIAELLKNLELSSLRTFEESKRQTESISQLVDSMSQRVEGALSQASGAMTEKVTALLSNLEVSSQHSLAESKKQTESLSSIVDSMSQRVEAVLNSASGTMTQTIGGLVSQTSQLSEATTTKLSALLEKQAEGATLLKDAGDVVRKSIVQFEDLLKASNETQQLYGESVRELRQVSTIILDDLKITRGVQSDITSVSASLREAGDNLKSLQSQNKDMLAEYQRVFTSIDGQVGSIIEKLHDNTQRYNETAREALIKNLRTFDDHLSGATQIIGQTVGELNEGLEELSDMVTRVLKKD